MKGFKIILSIIIMAFMVLFVVLILGIRTNLALRKDFKEKKEKVKRAVSAAQELELLQKEIISLQEESSRIDQKIPSGEKEPLELMKKLTVLANLSGVRGLSVKYADTEESTEGGTTSYAGDVSGPVYDVSMGELPTGPAVPVSTEVKEHYLTLKFECEFSSLVKFLRDILELERLVSIKNVEISRDDNIIPRQKIILKLIAYTFVAQ